ncbi:hypothetical protein AVEN_37740-1 [Araneus ventricosus]|uniref:Transposase Tc1-like domain-containing protein n=1 Tax=Araneus ventricosus TaxID=182803 RepID=A0A4Y2BUN7_ARAVE|nr:hypothetical protein AVEN_37740-1 [Araneus ventricosus]
MPLPLSPPLLTNSANGFARNCSSNLLTPKNQLSWCSGSRKHSVENKQRSGRLRTFSERDERWIVRQVQINPRTSAVKSTLKCKSRFRKSVNPETVRNVLRKHKYHGRVARRKHYISKANRKARLAFAKMYVKQLTEFWENVIFVDESKSNIFRSDGKQNVWHTPNTALHIKNVRPAVKYGGGNQLVWGCMASSGVWHLDFIDGTTNKYVCLP